MSDIQQSPSSDSQLSPRHVRLELTWTPRPLTEPADNFDLDVCAFLLNDKGKLPADEYFVFYNNLRSPADAVVLRADDIDGSDGEVMFVNLDQLPRVVSSLLFIVSIYNAEQRLQTFDQIANAKVTLYDRDSGKEILSHDLSIAAAGATAVEFALISCEADGQWRFQALDHASKRPLSDFVRQYVDAD